MCFILRKISDWFVESGGTGEYSQIMTVLIRILVSDSYEYKSMEKENVTF